MNFIYLLWHTYSRDFGEDETKLIGSYKTEIDAISAKARIELQPGFRDFPDGFEICETELNKDSWSEGFVIVINDYRSDGADSAHKIASLDHPWWMNSSATTHHVRPAPNGYWIYEIYEGSRSIGCEVGRVGSSDPFAKCLIENEAYEHAVSDMKAANRQVVVPSEK